MVEGGGYGGSCDAILLILFSVFYYLRLKLCCFPRNLQLRDVYTCSFSFHSFLALVALVAQSVRPFASHAEGWVFKSQPRQTSVLKTFSDSSTAQRSAKGVSVIIYDHYKGRPVSQYMYM